MILVLLKCSWNYWNVRGVIGIILVLLAWNYWNDLEIMGIILELQFVRGEGEEALQKSSTRTRTGIYIQDLPELQLKLTHYPGISFEDENR